MNHFNQHHFQQFHLLPRVHGYLGFNVKRLSVAERTRTANSLHHGMYCASCREAEQNGSLAAKLAELLELRRCDGCDEPHPSAFFFSEDVERHVRHSERLFCIGRLGKVTFCDHKACDAADWDEVERYLHHARRYWRRTVCVDSKLHCRAMVREPEPGGKYSPLPDRTTFPLLTICHRANFAMPIHIRYGWSLPILDISTTRKPDLSAIRDSLSRLVVDAVRGHRLCPHVSADKDLRPFARSGICECFAWRHSLASRCRCAKQRVLACRECGAQYRWLLASGRLYLRYRYSWNIKKPTSLGWLCLLDEEYRQKIYREDNKCVLWCDTPGCRTNTSGRWEAIVKADAVRGFEELPIPDRLHTDFLAMLGKSRESTFRLW